MLSLFLITLDSLICFSLIVVVLMQRSEGGAFGMGGGPTGLITTRGAGDLLTRTTWILFAGFLVVSLTLTLVGSHDKATSSIIEKLKLQHANTSELNQQAPPPAPTVPAPGAPAGASLLAPPIQSGQPLSAPAPQPLTTTVPNLAPPPAARPKHTAAPKADAAPAQAVTSAPPVLDAPAPKPAPAAPATGAP